MTMDDTKGSSLVCALCLHKEPDVLTVPCGCHFHAVSPLRAQKIERRAGIDYSLSGILVRVWFFVLCGYQRLFFLHPLAFLLTLNFLISIHDNIYNDDESIM